MIIFFYSQSMEFQPEGKLFLELILKDDNAQKRKLEANYNDNDIKNSDYEIVTRELYSWNKITTCIHNLFGTGNLWADLYGECIINCGQQSIKRRKYAVQKNRVLLDNRNTQEIDSDCNINETINSNLIPVMKCKLEFLSAAGGGYWSSNNRQPHEIQGTISSPEGEI